MKRRISAMLATISGTILMIAQSAQATMPQLTAKPTLPSPTVCKDWAAQQSDDAIEMWGLQEDGSSSKAVALDRLARSCDGEATPEIVGFGSSAAYDESYCKKFPKMNLCIKYQVGATEFPSAGFVSWRKIRVLSDAHTQLAIEGKDRKVYKIPGGVRAYFLNSEKAGPAVNICRAVERDSKLFIRCDREGGFRDGPRPRPWWWRYEAVIEGSVVKIVSVGQKDEALERGERVYEHFHDDVDQ